MCVPIAQLKGEKCKLICFQIQSVYTNSEASVGQVFPIARPRRGSVRQRRQRLLVSRYYHDAQTQTEESGGGGRWGVGGWGGGWLENETATVHNAIYY